ncbi:MAG: hypothetical protein EXS63_05070 [Candidatus Omnitrophica bacterium]|nr:hypothetical protein [Candidatus Omnitrophota bacterium]
MKIISLHPSLTEILCALGVEDQLAGVTLQCTVSNPDLPRVGSAKLFDLPLIESLKPDLVVVDAVETPEEELVRLRENLKILELRVLSTAHVIDTVWDLGRAAGVPERAKALKEEIAREKMLCVETFRDLEKLPTLILLWKNPYITINYDTYVSRLVEECGAFNVFHSESRRQFEVEIAEMIEKDPKLLLLATDPFSFKKAHIKKLREYRIFSKIPIELVDGRLFSYYGPRTVEALRTLREIVTKSSKKLSPDLSS